MQLLYHLVTYLSMMRKHIYRILMNYDYFNEFSYIKRDIFKNILKCKKNGRYSYKKNRFSFLIILGMRFIISSRDFSIPNYCEHGRIYSLK